MRTFQVFSVLLRYPRAELVDHRDELLDVIRTEGLLGTRERNAIERFLVFVAGCDPMEVEAEYVETFDRSRTLSLHLFEHIHGESRDRGQAMVDLRDHYTRHGLELVASELPDYLPVFLEFLSTQPPKEARTLLGETADIIATLSQRLEKRGSPYAAILSALLSLSARTPDWAAVQAILDEAERRPAQDALTDVDWEEPPAFGKVGGADDETGCPLAAEAVARMSAGR